MNVPKSLYLLFAVIGTLVPWFFFAQFIGQEGMNLMHFVKSLFPNGAASGFSADVLISATVFWIWSFSDAKENQVKHWWIVLPGTLTIGLSFALPMYLFLRSK